MREESCRIYFDSDVCMCAFVSLCCCFSSCFFHARSLHSSRKKNIWRLFSPQRVRAVHNFSSISIFFFSFCFLSSCFCFFSCSVLVFLFFFFFCVCVFFFGILRFVLFYLSLVRDSVRERENGSSPGRGSGYEKSVFLMKARRSGSGGSGHPNPSACSENIMSVSKKKKKKTSPALGQTDPFLTARPLC